MKIFSTYDGDHIGDVAETKLSQVNAFIKATIEGKKTDDLLSMLRSDLRNNANRYSILLSRETGNPVTWCKEEINEAIGLLESRNSHGYDCATKENLLKERVHAVADTVPVEMALVIGSKVAPLISFVEHILSSLDTGCRIIYSPSRYGSMTLSSLWENVSEESDIPFIPLFSNHEGKGFRKIISEAGRMKTILRGTRDSMENLADELQVSISLDEKIFSTAMVLDGDPDAIAKSIASSLRWVKDTKFSPRRILIKEDLLEYMFNAVSEEAYRLRYGDPSDPGTELPCFLNINDRDAFIQGIAQEKNQWNTVHSDPVIKGNSSSPAVLKVEDSFGPMWKRKPFWPFLIIKGVKSVEESFAIVRGSSDRSIILYSEDIGIFRKFSTAGFTVVSNPPSFISPREYLSLGSNSMEYLFEKRNIYYWS